MHQFFFDSGHFFFYTETQISANKKHFLLKSKVLKISIQHKEQALTNFNYMDSLLSCVRDWLSDLFPAG